ncbi:hypothetical protein CYMTET_24112 [Cymbomonas tetramitiformis]|uniref:Uncharacterized protein n=1 Tax=Cymbomonas tetramitiformis TaxID=36881 RepID=A0AAE0FXU6_9CHLO|nr:hypothetical protein CYMTET_24112 [Cymbomonas tetramitiformis]
MGRQGLSPRPQSPPDQGEIIPAPQSPLGLGRASPPRNRGIKIRVARSCLEEHEGLVERGLWWVGPEVERPSLGSELGEASVEVYIHRKSFVEMTCSATQQTLAGESNHEDVLQWAVRWVRQRAPCGPSASPDADLPQARAGQKAVNTAAPVKSRLRRMAKQVGVAASSDMVGGTFEEDGGVKFGEKRWCVHLLQGVTVRAVLCEKPGAIASLAPLPATRLDDFEHILGQFYKPFEEQFYFWQCWEITRRLLQSGLVLGVQLVFGEHFAAVWALIIATVAIVLHQRYLPYESDMLDELQLSILMNIFFMQVCIVYKMTTHAEVEDTKIASQVDVVDALFIGTQLCLAAYGISRVIPAIKGIMKTIWHTSSTMGQRLSTRLRSSRILLHSRRRFASANEESSTPVSMPKKDSFRLQEMRVPKEAELLSASEEQATGHFPVKNEDQAPNMHGQAKKYGDKDSSGYLIPANNNEDEWGKILCG